MKYYHATPFNNLNSILEQGLHRSIDGVVYLCEKPEDCLKFAGVHLIQHVLLCEVNIPASWVVETFDHNITFFKCRYYGSTKDIPISRITNYTEYYLGNIR